MKVAIEQKGREKTKVTKGPAGIKTSIGLAERKWIQVSILQKGRG